MSRIGWKELFEVAGVAAIVASLIFVGLQLQQDRHLIRAELGAESQDFSAMIDLSLSDPDVSSAWAKMLEHPEDLSAEEMLRVNSVLSATWRLFLRECYLVTMGVFAECESLVNGQAYQYFGSKYAQSWWRANEKRLPSSEENYGNRHFVNEAVTNVPESANRSVLEEIKAGL